MVAGVTIGPDFTKAPPPLHGASIEGNVGIGVTDPIGKLQVAGPILPSACNQFDLGSSSLQWRDLYLSGNTIHLDGLQISNDGANNLSIKDESGGLKNVIVDTIQLGDPATGTSFVIQNAGGTLVTKAVQSDGTPLNESVIQTGDASTAILSWRSNVFGAYIDKANVGIGTTQPRHLLDVRGEARLGSLVGPAITDSVGTASSSVAASAAAVKTAYEMATSADANANTRVLKTGDTMSGTLVVNEDVVVGKTLTTSNLRVLGTVTSVNTSTSVTSNVAIKNEFGIGPALSVTQKTLGDAGVIAEFFDQDISTTVPVFMVGDYGNVGIHTQTPKAHLHVMQSVQDRTIFRVDQVNDAKPSLVVAANGNIGINTTSITAKLEVNGTVRVSDGTLSTSSNTGALVVSGGMGIKGATFVGGALDVGETATIQSTTAATSSTTGALVVKGGVGVGGALQVAGQTHIDNTTASSSSSTGALVVDGGIGVASNVVVGASTSSTSTTTGALVVSGGVGIVGNMNVGGAIRFSSNINSTSTDSGTVVVTGGVGIGSALNVGGISKFSNSTASTSSSTGAVVVTGGVGVGGAMHVGGVSKFNDTTNATSTTTGAVVVTGGVGIGSALHVGGVAKIMDRTEANSVDSGALVVSGGAGVSSNLYVGGRLYLTSNVPSSSTTTGSVVVTGGVGIGSALNVGGVSKFSDATASTSTDSGAVVVSGGVGVGGAVHVGGPLKIHDTTASLSGTTGALVVGGGIGVAGSSTLAGKTQITSAEASTSTASGALVVTGGAGIGGSMFVGENASVQGSLTVSKNSTTTGNMSVSGTVYAASNITIMGKTQIQATDGSSSSTTGALVVSGGVGIAGALNVGGHQLVAGNLGIGTSSTSARLHIQGDALMTELRAQRIGASNGSVIDFQNVILSNVSKILVGTLEGTIQGNAEKADKLATVRNITLSGTVSGSATFDGSSDATINTVLANNAVTLGTHTTGDYVASIAAGQGISISGSSGESAAVTVSNIGVLSFNTRTGGVELLDADVTGALGFTPFNAAGGVVSGNTFIRGDLTTCNINVLGSVSTIQAITTQYSNVSIQNTLGVGPALRVTQKSVLNGLGTIAEFIDEDDVNNPKIPILIVADNHKVGINTSIPSSSLHVVGAVSANEFRGVGSNLTYLNPNSLCNVVPVAKGGTGTSSIAANKLLVANASGDAVLTPSALHWDQENGRLGVGVTVAPASALQVAGHITPSACNTYDLGSSTLRWRDLYLSGSTIDIEGLQLSKTSDNALQIGGTLSASSLSVGNTDSSVQWRISSSNNHFIIGEGDVNENSNVLTLTPDGNALLGTKTQWASYRSASYIGWTGSNLLLPTGNGTINGVNITALNRRARASYATAKAAVSTWIPRALTGGAENDAWYGVCWSPELSLFCAVSENAGCMTSSDGINWTAQNLNGTGAENTSWYNVCWSPQLSLFCAVGFSGDSICVMTSPDGVNWTAHDLSGQGAQNKYWYSICWSPELSLFCAVAYEKLVMTSSDGSNWTILDFTTPVINNNLSSVCWSPELSIFCAVGAQFVLTSSNGTTWTAHDLTGTGGESRIWYSVCWSPELSRFCAVGGSGSPADTSLVMTSPDGISWTISTFNEHITGYGICWSPELSLFCAVGIGNDRRIMTSLDGVHWNFDLTGITETTYTDFSGVCWSPELSMFCAVAYGGSYRVVTSRPSLPAPQSAVLANPSHVMVNPATGNVGIGTTIPQNRLHVSGTLFAHELQGDGSNLTNVNATMLNGFSSDYFVNSNTIISSNQLPNVGSLTASTYGSASSIPKITVDTKGRITNISTESINIPESSPWLSNTANANLYFVQGNVGIGTTTPLKRFEVSGPNATVRISDYTTNGTPSIEFVRGTLNTFGGDIITDWRITASNNQLIIGEGDINGNSNVLALTPEGNALLGSYTQWASYRTTSNVYWVQSNLLLPSGNGTLNGVSITALNRRTRASFATAKAAVSTWIPRTLPAEGVETNSWCGVCWSPELSIFCVLLSSGRVITSRNGIQWSVYNQQPVGNGWKDICWSPERSLFCAVGNGIVMTSTDGTNWTSYQPPAITNYALSCVCWSAELSLFCALTSNLYHNVITSADGINWTTRTIIATAPLYGMGWASVCWSPDLSLFCAVNPGGIINNCVVTSPDGVTWTDRYITGSGAEGSAWTDVCWSPELSLFCAVATSGNYRVMTSSNGITWNPRTIYGPDGQDQSWKSICWCPELSMFCAVSGNNSTNTTRRVMTSSDGVHWVTHDIYDTGAKSNLFSDICWSPELSIFCAVANEGGTRVMTSRPALPAPQSAVLANPSHVTVNQATGNVGIGITNPQHLMHVSGSFFANELRGDGSNVTNVNASRLQGYNLNYFVNSNTVISSNQLPDISGLTAQEYGSSSAIPKITVDTKGRITSIQTVTINIPDKSPWLSNVTNGDLYITKGNVGIGTTIPLYLLHVTGAIYANVYSNLPSASSVVAGIVKLSDSISSTSSLEAATSKAVSDTFNVASAALPKAGGTISGNLTVQGVFTASNVNVIGTVTTMNSLVSQSSNIKVVSDGIGPALYVSQKGVGLDYSIAEFYDQDVSTTTPVLKVAEGGNIGIGTTNPSHKLHIYCSNNTNNDYEAAGILLENARSGEVAIALRGGAIPSTSNWFMGVNSNQTRLDVGYGLQSDQLNDVDADLTIITTGNVGIGSTIPGTKLDVNGIIRTNNQIITTLDTGTAPFSIVSTTRVGNLNVQYLDGADSNFYRNATNINSGTLGVAYGGTSRASIDANKLVVGNGINALMSPANLHWDNTNSRLGIGSTIPQHMLHVSGIVFANELRGDGSNLTSVNANLFQGFSPSYFNNSNTVISSNQLPDIAGNIVSGQYGGSTAIPRITIDNKGRIIGISTDAVSTNVKEWSSNTTNGDVFVTNGNVGVGISNPQQRLEVERVIRVSDYSADGVARIELVRGDSNTFGGDISTDWHIMSSNNQLIIGEGDTNGNSNVLILTSFGNVGIGTNQPQAKLNVEGDAIIGYSSNNRVAVASYSPFWQQQEIQSANPTADGNFGFSVAISADGNTLIVGAFRHIIPVVGAAGSTFIFIRNGSSWNFAQELQASNPVVNDKYGQSVAISSDGNTVVIGAPGRNSSAGSVYISTRNGTTWSTPQEISSPNPVSNSYFGYSVSINADGNTVIVGVRDDTIGGVIRAGSTYVFAQNGSTWNIQQQLQASSPTNNGYFGHSVSISADGNTLIIGENARQVLGKNGAGCAYIFSRNGSIWTLQQQLQLTNPNTSDGFGGCVAISADGSYVVVGAPDRYVMGTPSGSAFVFTRSSSSVWSLQQEIHPTNPVISDNFGFSTGISADGKTIIVGSSYRNVSGLSYAGSAFIFTRNGSTWSLPQEIYAANASSLDYFGTSVSLSANGSTAIIGAYSRDSSNILNAGSAFIFTSDLIPLQVTVGGLAGTARTSLIVGTIDSQSGTSTQLDFVQGLPQPTGRIANIYEGARKMGIAISTYNNILNESVRITNAGDVGIGSTSPGAKLDVNGTIRTNNQIISTLATGTAPLNVLSTTMVTNLNAEFLGGSRSNAFMLAGSEISSNQLPTVGNITAGTYGSSSAIPVITVDTKGRVVGISTNAGGGGGGSTGWTLKDTNNSICEGSVGIGTTLIHSSYRLYVGGAIYASGDITGLSDERYKTDVERIQDPLAKISQLGGYTFFKKDETRRTTGLIAQEVQRVLPEAIMESDQGLALAYGNMAGLFVEAINELQKKMLDMETKLDQLLARQ